MSLDDNVSAENIKRFTQIHLTDGFQGKPGFYWALEKGFDEEIKEAVAILGPMAREIVSVNDLYPLPLGSSPMAVEIAENYDIIAGPFKDAGLLGVTQAHVLEEKYFNKPSLRN